MQSIQSRAKKANLVKWQNIYFLSKLLRTVTTSSKILRVPVKKAQKIQIAQSNFCTVGAPKVLLDILKQFVKLIRRGHMYLLGQLGRLGQLQQRSPPKSFLHFRPLILGWKVAN